MGGLFPLLISIAGSACASEGESVRSSSAGIAADPPAGEAGPSSSSLLPTSLALPPAAKFSRIVKVAVVQNEPSVSVELKGGFTIRRADTLEALSVERSLNQFLISAGSGGLQINGTPFPADAVILDSEGKSIKVGSRFYQDRIRILKDGATVTAVNEIDIEEYVKGVLPLEASPRWPIESLKAHAVVSRTFALFKAREKKDRNFYLHSTVTSQVYGGSLFHQSETDQAVDLTRGEILTFGGRIFPAYFHASCGGRTARADEIWPVEANPVLKGAPCSFCKGTKHYVWTLRIPLAEIEAVMQKEGYPAKNLQEVRFLDFDSSGRARTARLVYARSEATIQADRFRAFLGPDRLRSLKANAAASGNQLVVSGFGWGHGAGFCQWGAKGQAEQGKSYREILQFYFPGSEIKTIKNEK